MVDAFDAVYGEYGRSVHSYLARLTGDRWAADELCQETFVRYLHHRERLQRNNGTLGAWLYTVATNLARDRARRRRPQALAHDPRAAGGDGAAAAEAHDLAERIRREVDRLPEELKEVFLLRAHEELTYPRLATVLGVSVRTAKERFRRAREILAHRLEGAL